MIVYFSLKADKCISNSRHGFHRMNSTNRTKTIKGQLQKPTDGNNKKINENTIKFFKKREINHLDNSKQLQCQHWDADGEIY